MSTSRTQRAFTLIELLVVVAIIAALASILFPVFARAREKAWQTACQANQRQIAAAITMYIQDHGDKFFSDPVDTSWASYLTPYNEGSIYDCPGQQGDANHSNPEYGFNRMLFDAALDEVPSPASSVMVVDANIAIIGENYAIFNWDKELDRRHNEGAILCCVDGHVAFESLKDKTAIADELTKRQYNLFDMGMATKPIFKFAGPVTVIQNHPEGQSTWTSTSAITMPTGTYVPEGGDTMPNTKFAFDIQFPRQWAHATWFIHTSGFLTFCVSSLPNTVATDNPRRPTLNGGLYSGLKMGEFNVFSLTSYNGGVAGVKTSGSAARNEWYHLEVLLVNNQYTTSAYENGNYIGSHTITLQKSQVAAMAGMNKMGFTLTSYYGGERLTARNLQISKLP